MLLQEILVYRGGDRKEETREAGTIHEYVRGRQEIINGIS